MSERKPGWYWAKHEAFDDPQVVQYCPKDGWMIAGIHGSFDEEFFEEIGDRIPAPDEPWVCVPVEATDGMVMAGHHQIDWVRPSQNTYLPEHDSHVGSTCRDDLMRAYKRMLSASPKP